jgi:hypothetical protein
MLESTVLVMENECQLHRCQMPEWWQLGKQIGLAKIFHCSRHEGIKDTNGFSSRSHAEVQDGITATNANL